MSIAEVVAENFPALLVGVLAIAIAVIGIREYRRVRDDVESTIQRSVRAEIGSSMVETRRAMEAAQRSADELNAINTQAREQFEAFTRESEERRQGLEEQLDELQHRVSALLEAVPEDLSWVSPRELVLRARTADDWSEAAPLLRALFASDDATAIDLELGGDEARQRGALGLAKQLYTRAVERDPEHVSAQAELARLVAETEPGEPRNQALARLREFARDPGSGPNRLVQMANAFIAVDRYAELAEAAEEILASGGDLPDAQKAQLYRDWAVASREMGDQEGARARFEAALQLDPRSANTLRAYIGFLRDDTDMDRARDMAMALVAMDPADPDNLYRLAEVEEQAGNDAEAETWSERVLEVIRMTPGDQPNTQYLTMQLLQRVRARRALADSLRGRWDGAGINPSPSPVDGEPGA